MPGQLCAEMVVAGFPLRSLLLRQRPEAGQQLRGG